jgi:hypothetical protein
VKLALAGTLVAAVKGACASDQSRAEKLEAQAAAAMNSGDARNAARMYDEAIRIKPSEQAYLGRAGAVAAAGDRGQAAESLEGCDRKACEEKRAALAREAIKALGDRAVTDPASLDRYLRWQKLAGTWEVCALTLAVARASGQGVLPNDTPLHKALVSALDAEIVRTKGRLNGMRLDDPDLANALSFGSAIGDETDCSAVEKADGELMRVGRVAAQMGGARGAAIYNEQAHRAAMLIGFLTATRGIVSGGPGAVAATKNWKNGGPCAGVAQLEIGQSCKTSRGALVRREKRGEISGTRLNGLFWSDHLPGEYLILGPTDQGAAACAKLRMRLPSKQDFISIQRAFEVQLSEAFGGTNFSLDGRAEFHKVFWDATEFVWSSTKAKYGRWGFVSDDGFLEAVPGGPGHPQRVVCVAR